MPPDRGRIGREVLQQVWGSWPSSLPLRLGGPQEYQPPVRVGARGREVLLLRQWPGGAAVAGLGVLAVTTGRGCRAGSRRPLAVPPGRRPTAPSAPASAPAD